MKVVVKRICAFLTSRSQIATCRVGRALSAPVYPHGGIPQGTKLVPILFAVLVSRLADSLDLHTKYVDDTTVFECVPRCSPSYLPFVVQWTSVILLLVEVCA